MTLPERIEQDTHRLAQTELDTLNRVLGFAKRQAKICKDLAKLAEDGNMNISACLHEAQAEAYTNVIAEIRACRNFFGNPGE